MYTRLHLCYISLGTTYIVVCSFGSHSSSLPLVHRASETENVVTCLDCPIIIYNNHLVIYHRVQLMYIHSVVFFVLWLQ